MGLPLVQGPWKQSPDDVCKFPNKIQRKQLLHRILCSGLLVVCSHSENNCLQRILYPNEHTMENLKRCFTRLHPYFFSICAAEASTLTHCLIHAWIHTNHVSSGQLHSLLWGAERARVRGKLMYPYKLSHG